MSAADAGAATVNAAVAVGQRTADDDAMWKTIFEFFEKESATTQVDDEPSECNSQIIAIAMTA